MAKLLQFWERMRCEHIYRTDAWSIMKSGARWLSALMLLSRRNPVALLDNAPLRELLPREFNQLLRQIGGKGA